MIRLILFLLTCLLILPFAPVSAKEEGIAAVVNQDAVSLTDLADRSRLVILSSGLPDTPEIRTKLTSQVMANLIEEQLMIQEAEKRKIKIAPEEIEQGFAAVAQQNKLSAAQFKEMIAHSGINVATMQRQIRAQMGWSKVIQKVIHPQITVTEADVDEYLDRLNANKGKEEYLLAEIFLPVETAAQDAAVQQLAIKLTTEMRTGKAPFGKVAQQFSKAAGASQGGDLGWLQQEQVMPELVGAVQNMSVGHISDPVRSMSGYHIVILRDKRVLSDENIPTREQVMNTIGVQRMDRMQRRYLMDLKNSAFIENRVQS